MIDTVYTVLEVDPPCASVHWPAALFICASLQDEFTCIGCKQVRPVGALVVPWW